MSIAEKLTTVAENVPKVYEQGKADQEQDFWSTYMNPGNDLSYRFAGFGWYPTIFKPSVDMKPKTSARGMFTAFNYYNKGGQTFDLVEHLKELGVTLDFSSCVNMQECFGSAHISRVGVIDIRKSSNKYGIFATDWLETIDELIVDENYVYNSIFNGAKKLTNLKITGVIGKNGFSVAQSTKLSKASNTSIINALSTTTSGLTVTLSKTAVNKAFETSEGANDGSTSEEWSALEATKTNWTISLA